MGNCLSGEHLRCITKCDKNRVAVLRPVVASNRGVPGEERRAIEHPAAHFSEARTAGICRVEAAEHGLDRRSHHRAVARSAPAAALILGCFAFALAGCYKPDYSARLALDQHLAADRIAAVQKAQEEAADPLRAVRSAVKAGEIEVLQRVPGRFIVVQCETRASSAIIKMDTETGESWFYGRGPDNIPKWYELVTMNFSGTNSVTETAAPAASFSTNH